MRNVYDIRRLWLRKVVKIYTLLFTVSLGLYFVFALLDPGLLSYDLRQKFHALADDTIVVTATVLGPPVQPVVTATPDCDEHTGTLSVMLDWADDPNTYTYDVDRDTSPLVTGLSASSYRDTTVLVNTTYEYQVTAHGPMGAGFATSDPVSVTTPAECDVTLPDPSVAIVSFAGKNVDAYKGTYAVTTKRPLFTGTTNMPEANMVASVAGNFITEFSANSNGYWEWRPASNLTSGTYTFSITATDKNDTARTSTATLIFTIKKKDSSNNDGGGSGGNNGGGKKGGNVSGEVSVIPGINMPVSTPVQFSLSLESSDASVLQGRELRVFLSIKSLIEQYFHITIPIRYSLMDKDYNIIFSELRQSYITEGAEIHESFAIPDYVKPGKYFMQVEMLFNNLSVSRMVPFSVLGLPLIELPSGKAITYADVIHNLGWLVFCFLFSFLIWLSLFIREFALMLRGGKTVTEYDLKKAGFIRK